MTFLDFGFRVKETLAKNHILFAVTYLDESGRKFLQKTFCKMHPKKNVHESIEANVNPFCQPPTFLCVLVTNLLLQILRPLILISKECLDPIF